MTTYLRGFVFFFFNDTATTEIYTLSLHDALPISFGLSKNLFLRPRLDEYDPFPLQLLMRRSEEHTSELQSRSDLVCRLLLEKKKKYYGFLASTSCETVTGSLAPPAMIRAIARAAR